MKINTNAKNSLFILIIDAIVAASVMVRQKVQIIISKGLSDSQKIRMTEANTCDKNSNKPQFNGCNSII